MPTGVYVRKPFSAEHRAKLSAASKISCLGNKRAFGHRLSDECKERIRIKCRGRKHTSEERMKQSVAQMGREVLPETRAKISESNRIAATPELRKIRGDKHRAWWATLSPEDREEQIRKMTRITSPTSLEFALQMLLESAGLEYEAQVSISGRQVDFWVESHGLVWEADGSMWHQDAKYEEMRDQQLIIDESVTSVIHLSEFDLWPWMLGGFRRKQSVN